jgi:hypothetical protein
MIASGNTLTLVTLASGFHLTFWVKEVNRGALKSLGRVNATRSRVLAAGKQYFRSLTCLICPRVGVIALSRQAKHSQGLNYRVLL